MRAAHLALAALLAGCATPPAKDDPRPVAKDPVCLYRRDLGCIDVRVDADTPRSEYGGKTWFFCSPDCKAAFDREPAKYARAGPAKRE